ncbi:hypothetical protein M0Q97_07250 [Candidatus Dojkabacteria bacterium]|jgi:hypothetical protein|nr:hypothetical protein [Candidatus Dojkabacteria bacterium]
MKVLCRTCAVYGDCKLNKKGQSDTFKCRNFWEHRNTSDFVDGLNKKGENYFKQNNMKQNWYLIVYKHFIDTPSIKYIEDCTEEEMLEKINPIVDAKDFHTISRVIFFDEDNLLNKDSMWYLIRIEFKKVKFGEYYSEDLIYNALQTYSDLHRNDDFNISIFN